MRACACACVCVCQGYRETLQLLGRPVADSVDECACVLRACVCVCVVG